jgi:hypothetical protein
MTGWKPPQYLRPMALGIARRGNALLVFRVIDASGQRKGARPLGGQIELFPLGLLDAISALPTF